MNIAQLQDNYIVAKRVHDEAAKLKKEIMKDYKEVFVGIDEMVRKANVHSDLERDFDDGKAVMYKNFDVVRLGDYYAAFSVKKSKKLDSDAQKKLNAIEREAIKTIANGKPYENDYIQMRPPSGRSDFENFLKISIPKERLKELGVSMTALLKLPIEEQREIVKKAIKRDYIGSFLAATNQDEIKVLRIGKEYSATNVMYEKLKEVIDFKKIDMDTVNIYDIVLELKKIYQEDNVDNLFLVLKELKEIESSEFAQMWKYEIEKFIDKNPNANQFSKIVLLKSIKYGLQDEKLLENEGILVPKADRKRFIEDYGKEEHIVSLYAVSDNLFEIKATIDAVSGGIAQQKRLKSVKIPMGV